MQNREATRVGYFWVNFKAMKPPRLRPTMWAFFEGMSVVMRLWRPDRAVERVKGIDKEREWPGRSTRWRV